MTRKEAADAYMKISKELERLHGAASAHISRRDNNWVFERIYSFRYISQRIKLKYDVVEDYQGGGPHLTRAEARKQAKDAEENRRNQERLPRPGFDG